MTAKTMAFEPAARSAPLQGIEGALAGKAGDAGAVGEVSQFSRSRISPFEHPCEHTDGISVPWGWRASTGRGGTGSGNSGGEPHPEIPASAVKVSALDAQARHLFHGSCMGFLHPAAQGRLFSLGFFDGGHALALGARIAPVPPGPSAQAGHAQHHQQAAQQIMAGHASLRLKSALSIGSGSYWRSPTGTR